MIDAGVAQTLIVGHLWQSVAIAAVLAGALILGRRMRGTTRYDLAAVAMVASIVLPLAAFIPGESLARAVLDRINAPAPAVERPVQTEPSLIEKTMADAGAPTWAVGLGTQAIKAAIQDGAVPFSETAFGEEAVANGAPKWALEMGDRVLQAALQPTIVAPPPPKPLFTLPQIKLPEFSLPDLTLPLAMIWIAGALILLVRTFRDLLAVERLVARARPADLPEKLKIRMKSVRVAVSPDAPGPMAAGLFRPCIVLPENIALASPGMAALLEHERAHIERRDMVVALLQRVTLALLWWSPALYWISRRIDEEREVACDEAAVERTGNAKALARSLTLEAQNQLWARAPRLAVGAIGPRSQAGRRIKRLIEAAKGAPYAKYSGRLAFAGLALAVAIAAMVTPRFDAADAQQPGAPPPVDEALDGRPIDLTQDRSAGPRTRDLTGFRDQDWRDQDWKRDAGEQDFALLGDDFARLMEDLGQELEASLGALSPELEAELAGLSAEMAALGVEISTLVSQEVLNEMPGITEEIRAELEAEGIDVDDLEQWSEHSEEVREALQEAREELREALGPEMREEIRAAIEEARAEVAAHRDEIKAAVQESRAGMDIARQAMAQAKAEIAAARARGDFDRHHSVDIDFDFDRDADLDGGSSPAAKLYKAARRCNDEEVRRLITEDKVDVNTVLRGDGTPLIAAVRRGCEDAVRVLLNAGADPNLASQGDGNPLIAASQRGKVDMVRLLIDRGADVNGYVEHDETPLINAAEHGCLDVVKLLVDRGAKVNLAYTVETARGGKELRSPLNTALRHGHDDIASYLRSKGAVAEPKPAN